MPARSAPPVSTPAAATGRARPALAAGAELAPALGYFGRDAPDADYLHADELRAAENAGAVSLRPAFIAASEGGATFVQHRVAPEADEVWALLDAGARVYVCGDGSRPAPGVREAFRTLYRDRAPGVDATAVERWLNALMADGRYVEDVCAPG